jgi:hypothetical protein
MFSGRTQSSGSPRASKRSTTSCRTGISAVVLVRSVKYGAGRSSSTSSVSSSTARTPSTVASSPSALAGTKSTSAGVSAAGAASAAAVVARGRYVGSRGWRATTTKPSLDFGSVSAHAGSHPLSAPRCTSSQ